MRMACVHKITVSFAPNKLLINEVDGNFLCRRLNNNSIALCISTQMLCVSSKLSVNFCSHLPQGRCGLKFSDIFLTSSTPECHLPQGRCGLKFKSSVVTASLSGSPSARKVWIEIAPIDINQTTAPGHLPQGRCGLKSTHRKVQLEI